MSKLNKIIENYPPELKMVLVCCGSERWKAEDLLPTFNWELFLQLVKRHRVNPHVYMFASQNATFFPINISKQINQSQHVNTQRMLGLAGEILRLQSLFKTNNIINISIKGPALAYQLYNNPGMRHSMDLDFLVLAKDLEKTTSLLLTDGYKQIKPDFALSPRQKKEHLKLIHHYYFKHPVTGLLVEVHWKLITPPSLFHDAEKFFFNEIIPSAPIDHIKPELLLHFIIIHGSTHRWYKLFWLKDVDHFFRNNVISDFEYFNKLTLDFKNQRIVYQTIELLSLLFNTPIPKELIIHPASDKIIRDALNAVVTDESTLHQRTGERINKLKYLIRLKPGIKHFFTCLKAPATNYLDWKTLPLPDHLFFLYYPLRPFLWFWSVYIKKITSA